MAIPKYFVAALHWHKRVGIVTFLCSFVAILAGFALAAPYLSVRFAELFPQSRDSAFSTEGDSNALALRAATGQASSGANAPSALRPATDAEMDALKSQLKKLKEGEAGLGAEIHELTDRKHTARSSQQESAPFVAAPVPPAPKAPLDQAPSISPEERALRTKIDVAKRKLTLLKESDTDQHPDVVSAEDDLLSLENRLSDLQLLKSVRREGERPTGPPVASQELPPVPAPVTHPASLPARSTRKSSQVVKTRAQDRKIIDTLTASQWALRLQIAALEKQIAGRQLAISDGPQAAPDQEPLESDRLAERTQPDRVSEGMPVLSWFGGLVFGSPIAFVLALIIAFGAMLFSGYRPAHPGTGNPGRLQRF